MTVRSRWPAVVLPTIAVAGALWSVIPFAVWWANTDRELVAGAWRTWGWGTGVVLGITAVLMILSAGRAPGWVLRGWRQTVGRWPRAVVIAAAAAGLVVFAIAVYHFVFSGNARSVDGFAQLFHARILLSGRTWIEPPPELANFATLHMILGPDKWYSQYPPGQPLVLAAGLALGVWWLFQPLFGIGLVVAVYRLAHWVAGETTARLSVALLAVCPFVVVMTASELTHLPAAALGLGAAAAATLLSGRRAGVWAVTAGGLLGLMLAFRPLDAVAAAVPVGIIVLATAKRRVVSLALVALGGVLCALPTLAFNAATTGRWSEFGYSHLWGSGIALGFHDVPWGLPLTLARAIGLTNLDLHQLNMYLFDLPFPVLPLAAAGYVLGRHRIGPRDAVPFAAVLTLFALLFFYFHRDTFYGPRLVFSVVPWLVIMIARSIVLMRESGSALAGGLPRGTVAVVGMVVALGFGLFTLAPSRMATYRASTPMLNLNPDRDAARAGIHDAVVLVPDGWGSRLIARMWALRIPVRNSGRLYAGIDACTLHRTVTLLGPLAALGRPGVRVSLTQDENLRVSDWEPLAQTCRDEIAFDRRGVLAFAPVLYYNNATLDGDIVWARDMRDGNAALFARYPERRFYRYELPAPDAEPRLVPVTRRLAPGAP